MTDDINWKAEWEAVCSERIKDRQRSQEIINERDAWIADLIRENEAAASALPAPGVADRSPPSFTVSAGVLISRSGAEYSPVAARKLAAVMVEGAISSSPSMAGGYLSELAEMVDALRLLNGQPKVIPLRQLASYGDAARNGGVNSSLEATSEDAGR